MNSGRSARGGGLAGGIGWAIVFWLIGRYLAPPLAQWVDSVDLWNKHYSEHPQIQNLFLLLLQIPVLLITGVFILALRLIVGTVSLAQRFYVTAIAGFFFGLSAGTPSSLFHWFGGLFGSGAKLVGVSAVEVFTMRRASHRAWALVPVVIAAVLLFYAYRFVENHWPTTRPPVQQMERFRPTASWRAYLASGGTPFSVQLTTVDVEQDRVAVTLRFRNDSGQRERLRIDRHTSLRMGIERSFADRWFFVLGDDQRVSLDNDAFVEPGAVLEGTLYFRRAAEPFEPWWLTVCYITNNKTCSGPMYFDLTRSSP